MMEHRMPARFNLFRLLVGLKTTDNSRGMDLKIAKSENNKDDDFIPENANSKVLVEYYKNLGRGPL